MKLSELKAIIMECIYELNEGPAREHRKKTGIRYNTYGVDQLSKKEKYYKEKSPSDIEKKNYTRERLYLNRLMGNMNKHTGLNNVIHHRKIAVGGNAESNTNRQLKMRYGQFPSKLSKKSIRGKLPK